MTPQPFARVLLVGFMGAGKTSVGKAVARGLGWRFIDFDDAVEVDAGMSVSELFEAHGEPTGLHHPGYLCAQGSRRVSRRSQ